MSVLLHNPCYSILTEFMASFQMIRKDPYRATVFVIY